MLKEIDLTYNLIEDNFKLDKELIEKYHIEEGNDYKKCSKRTFEDLQNVDESFKLYGYFEDDKLIGFFGTELGNYINTIFVKPEYRNKEYMNKFVDSILDTVGNKFYTALYNKNTRAINFYKKLGGQVIEKNNKFKIIKVEV